MNTVNLENDIFVYNRKKKKTVLLDCTDFLSNKSRIPMHSLAGDLTVPELIVSLIDDKKPLALADLLLDILVVSQLVKTAFPVKVLEIGAASGVVSYHLATLLGKFHPESFLCCISDSIGSDSESRWLDHIVLVEEPPKLSFLAGDYDDTHLQENEFDLIVINGIAVYESYQRVICEAERLIKMDGTVICYSIDSPSLEKDFKIAFPQTEEYPVLGNVNIMVASSFEKRGKLDQIEEICSYIKEIRESMAERRPIEIENFLDKIRGYLEIVHKEKNTDVKIQLIDLRACLIELLMC